MTCQIVALLPGDSVLIRNNEAEDRHMFSANTNAPLQVIEMMWEERKKSLSHREWKHRMAGYGYAIKDTSRGQVVESLNRRMEICSVPPELCM